MTVLPIRTVPDPVLRTPASPVSSHRFGSDSLRQLINDMFETMDDVGGVGLAAPQVGKSLSIFTFDIDGVRGHIINPDITNEDSDPDAEDSETGQAEQTVANEGCLSVPGLFYPAIRYPQSTVTGVDVEGNSVRYSGTGMLARCFQHETDHLHGTLFVDRLTGTDRKDARRRMNSPEFGQSTADTQHERASRINSSFGLFQKGQE